MEKVIEIIKNRILLAEDKKKNSPTEEMAYFWDGQLRCAQALLNEVAHEESIRELRSGLTKRAADDANAPGWICLSCGGVILHEANCPAIPHHR